MSEMLKETMEGLGEGTLDFVGGRLILRITGKLFPRQGGAECGHFQRNVDLTAHIEEIVRRAIDAALTKGAPDASHEAE